MKKKKKLSIGVIGILLLLFFIVVYLGANQPKPALPVLGEVEEIKGEDTFVSGGFTYSSSIDDIKNLYARIEYKDSGTKLPLVILMHGYVEQVSDIEDDVFTRYADEGAFVLAVGMRGRDGADGKKDASARELYDIYDAINYVIKDNYSDVIDAENISFVGYSGGGANGLGMAVKYPDLFDNIVAHFPISDYGYDNESGWWQQDTYPRDRIEDYIGGTPDEVPNAYFSRAHALGIGNYSIGNLYLFEDEEDEAVSVKQTTDVVEQLEKLKMDNYYVDITDKNDNPRWLHSLPQPDQPVINTEKVFMPDIVSHKHDNKGIATKGIFKVMGYIVTKDFEIWLGDGTKEVADLAYDVSKKEYTVTPLTGEMEVTIKQGGETTKQTIKEQSKIVVK
ncbi:prolyl oligopeptidase family serine peptidase [Niallia taxi]|uniref:alpha/beta hydrolase family protein n=1 Tax=Niallia taxi TaxID=2499688 RepID=UPI00203E06D6|nr:prolyl oligopeptidase family serine peptidase [Niallia taxi]MCM3216353.1 prolyl oligopeptidase family serine peptidase [Niallia taxi]